MPCCVFLNPAQLCKEPLYLLNHTVGVCQEITDILNKLLSAFPDGSHLPLPHNMVSLSVTGYVSTYGLNHYKSIPDGKFLIPGWFPILCHQRVQTVYNIRLDKA